ncbi:HNH endonuclease (plasmid) [Ralstonia pseudosolanacearum]
MPLYNDRWSWGAERDNVIVLRVWDDQYNVRARRVVVLDQQTLLESASAGLDERVQHLKAIWNGGVAAYAVIATAVDPSVDDRSIKFYRDDLFAIESLEVDDKGTFYACFSSVLSPSEFRGDAATHRTAVGVGPFSVDEQLESGLSSATVSEKLPHMRDWLIGVARSGTPVKYADLMRRFDLWYGTLFTSLKLLGQACVAADEPVITALVVDKKTGRCSKGFKEVFGISDDEAERQRCYAYWEVKQQDAASQLPPDEVAEPETLLAAAAHTTDREECLARFMNVEIRQQQQAFRKAVFEAYGGRCAVSGCDIPEALEAAHLLGRDWRKGHNQAGDGILLRRDLHTLYDRGLLELTDGIAQFNSRVAHHYGHLEGVGVSHRTGWEASAADKGEAPRKNAPTVEVGAR